MMPRQLREALAGQVESICRQFLPNGRKVGHEWVVGSLAGEDGQSLKVQLVGERRGLWKDFANNEIGGDLIDLIRESQGLSISDGIKAAKRYLGVADTPLSLKHAEKVYKKPERPTSLSAVSKLDIAHQLLVKRGLEKAIEPYKIAMADDGKTIVFPYLDAQGELVHIGYRDAATKKFWTSKDTRPSLFGWQAIPDDATSVVLTEGQLDAMAMWVYGFPALSIPYGAGKGHHDWIATEWDNLERFDILYIAFDQDEAGQQAVGEVINRLGRHRCRLVTLPRKDANDCLTDGIPTDVIRRAVEEATALDPAQLRQADGYYEEVHDEFYPKDKGNIGFAPPWPWLGKGFQFRYGETTVLAGINGHGKSEGVGHIALCALAQDVRTCVASLEFKPRRWLARIARQALCTVSPEPSRLRALHDWYADRLWVFDVVGKARMEEMLDVFLYAYRRYGVKFFVIDNMSKCGLDEDDYNGQKRFIEMATAFGIEHNVHMLIVAHMRKGEGKSEEKGGKWSIKGTGAITDLVDNVILWFRDKGKEQKLREYLSPNQTLPPEQIAILMEELKNKPDATCEVHKQRNGDGTEPYQRLWFHTQSHQFLSERNGQVARYL
jgi:twinkle protein